MIIGLQQTKKDCTAKVHHWNKKGSLQMGKIIANYISVKELILKNI